MATTSLRSDLGPLTTTFTPPADCTEYRWRSLCYTYTTSSSNGPDPWSTSIIQSCYPQGFASFYNRHMNSPEDYLAVYSPGSICPSGYTAACTQVRSKGQPNPFENVDGEFAAAAIWDLLRDGETALGCCPIGYDCDDVDVSACASTASRPVVVTDTLKCPDTLTPVTHPTLATYFNAQRVVVVHAAIPEHSATGGTATSAPTSTAPTSTAPTSSSPVSSVASENPVPKSSQGLPLAAKIAIGVLIPLVAILSGAMCFFIYRYRRKRKQLQAVQGFGQDAPSSGSDDLETPKAELPGDDGMTSSGPNGTAFRKAELDALIPGSGGVAELPAELAGGGLSELHGSSSPGELDSMSKGLGVVDVVGKDDYGNGAAIMTKLD
ncbi:uncharacterized protein TRIVIDRAFT_62915 [Trichoderma virens Gv29-8]|uniref:Uncharacterized protein n=1 Tax=Hypocrea virens (strain Gv29-8 / FGSC 10586) TaxID=413071 RepID=G9MFH5_HYPVG|nr:uncharacterized protein TRIVIDRAFT_62915 [Trichoderma virens Gv29-8]EHK27141.1 hypothetical protein TRIVIDRAFT_62915 [Trichoderma virens Gv29-8]